MSELKRDGRTVYVPVADSELRRMILPGSGIVGTVQKFGQVLIDYEGNRYGSAALESYTERVLHAYDRHVWHGVGYPTVARSLVRYEKLLEVGFIITTEHVSDEQVRAELSARYGRELYLAEIRRMPEFEITRRQMQRPRVVIDRQDLVDEWCAVAEATR